jgi:hypothetical protein
MDLHASVGDGATLYIRILYLTALTLSIGKPFNQLYTSYRSSYIALLSVDEIVYRIHNLNLYVILRSLCRYGNSI